MIYAFFPIISSAGYALLYIFLHRAYEGVSTITYFFWGGIVQVIAAIAMAMVLKDQNITFNLTTIKQDYLTYMIAALLIGSPAWLLGLYAIKHTSPLYVAFAEISYPLFIIAFMILFFQMRSIDWTVIMGGSLIMIGSAIMLYGQIK